VRIIMNESISSLDARLRAIIGRLAPELDGDHIVDVVLETALRKDERIDPLGDFAKDLKLYLAGSRKVPSLVGTSNASRSYDFHGVPALLHLPRLTQEASDLAKENGVAAISLKNTGGVHSLSSWVQGLAEGGQIAIFAWNGGSYTTVPFGSADPYFGTNPIAFGIPATDGAIVADMSTSEIPFMDLTRALATGTSLRPGAGLTNEGVPTSDPLAIYDENGDDTVRLRPLGGGAKGSAIMLLLEVLTGGLVGAKMGRAATDDPFTPEEFGGLLIVLDPSNFGNADGALPDIDSLARDVRTSRPASGFSQVQLPGDGERKRKAQRVGQGELLVTEKASALLDDLESRSA
jgi:ureidoglycolate dehydrogenase (NAD+)